MGKSPINVENLCYFLEMYPNRQEALLLKDGFLNGFRLGFKGTGVETEARNLKFARMNPEILKDKIDKEVQLGRFAGPFKTAPLPKLKISPVGLIPKADKSYRLITHLSHPEGCSVNDGIGDELSSVSYTSFDNVASMIFQMGTGSEMAKRDIKSAFRLLPIAPEDFWLLGLKDEEGNIYIDKFLPMGCKISCALFEKFATFLHWLVQFLSGQDTLDHYLDDFIFGGAQGTSHCRDLVENFMTVCEKLAVPVANEKSVGPCTKLIFLGLELDSVCLLIRIPLHKIEELQEVMAHIITCKKVTLREFQSMVGKLAFFSRAICSSRAFLRRFYDAMINIKKSYHRIRISKEIRQDISMWLVFLNDFNGVSYIPEGAWYDSDTLQLFTDSAGSRDLGCGCFFQQEWAYFQWPHAWGNGEVLKDITFLEMVPVLLSLELWGEQLKHRRLILYIDNEALVAVINKQTSRSKRLMRLVRPFVLKCMQFGILFKARHITTYCNDIADSISRKQWARFRQLAPEAKQSPQALPESFLSKISGLNLSDC